MKGKAADDATWEDVSTMRGQFPTFNLEDNVGVSEGSIVSNHVAENDPNEFYHLSLEHRAIKQEYPTAEHNHNLRFILSNILMISENILSPPIFAPVAPAATHKTS